MAESLPLVSSVRTTLPSAVIFDLDGTLIDSAHDVTIALNRILPQKDAPRFTADEVKPLMGEGVRAVIQKALLARGLRESESGISHLKEQFLDIYCRERVSKTTAYPFAAAVIDELSAKRISVGVCTHKDEGAARLILRQLGFDRQIGAVIGADSGFGRKPAPAPLLACASRLSVSPDQVVYVGDHRIDVETARAANIPVVAVAYGYSGEPVGTLGANRTITCLSELPVAICGLI